MNKRQAWKITRRVSWEGLSNLNYKKNSVFKAINKCKKLICKNK